MNEDGRAMLKLSGCTLIGLLTGILGRAYAIPPGAAVCTAFVLAVAVIVSVDVFWEE